LDRYYFDLLVYALELTDSAYVPGFRIWQREIPWPGHGITRDGYIFLGATNERSTAQPERDFYIHFLGLYTQNGKESHTAEDEIYFVLKQRDNTFDKLLRLYAGAREMGTISSGSNKSQYERKADEHRQQLANWLRDNLARSFSVRYCDKVLAVTELIAAHRLSFGNLGPRDQVFQLAAALFSALFEQRYPNYPKFVGLQLTQVTLPQVANATLRAVAGGPVTRPAQSLLEGLHLARFHNGAWLFAPEKSPYVQPLLQKMASLPADHVLNRSDLLTGDSRRERMVHTRLEPEWLAVILLTLVRQGEIVLNLRGLRIGVDDLEQAAQIGVEELVRFHAIARPKALPEQTLRTLFAGLELPEALVQESAQHGLAVQSLKSTVERELERALTALERLRKGIDYWRFPVLTEAEIQEWREQLETYRQLLENLIRIKTPGHFRNFAMSEAEVKRSLRGRATLQEMERLQQTLDALRPSLEYVYQAENHLPTTHQWQKTVQETRTQYQALLQDPNQRFTPTVRARLNGGLENLHDHYTQVYLEQHAHARLTPTEDARKQALVRDSRHLQLKALSGLDLLPATKLQQWEQKVQQLVTCIGCTATDLRNQVTCPHCGYSPQSNPQTADTPAIQRLAELEKDLDLLYTQWTTTLREELSKPTAQETIELLPDGVRNVLQAFVRTGALPPKVTHELVDAMQDALRGLEKVTFDSADLLLALTRAGMPCTPDALEERFRTFLHSQVNGQSPSRLRIQIEW